MPNSMAFEFLQHMFLFIKLLMFYTIATVFQLYHCGDMTDEIRQRKLTPTLLLTQGIFNLPHDKAEKAQAYTFTDSRNL